jgi:capsular exopolysaccharide synthesis family protein
MMIAVDRAELFRVVGRRKLVAILTAALVVIGGVLFLIVQPRTYESSASVALLPAARNPDTLGAYDAIVTRLLPLYASRVRSRSFLDRVARQLPGQVDGKDLESKVFAKPDPGAAVLKVVARANDDPQRAAVMAQAATEQLLSELRGTRIVNFEVIDQPRVPDAPVAPRAELVLPASLLLAAFLAVATALVWDRLFGRIRDLQELKRASGARVLGAFPYEPLLPRSSSSLIVGDPTMAAVEGSLRNLRTVLLGPGLTTPAFQKITLTSLHPGDGKSTLAANLAVVIAEAGLHALVVDADIQRPRQHEIFDLPNDQGLSTAVDVRTVVHAMRLPKVSVVTAGPVPQRRSEILEQYMHVVPKLSELAEFVIIDSPPLSANADVELLAAMTDGAVLLVRSGSTSAEQLRQVLDELDAVGVPVLGLVLTMGAKTTRSYGRYGYGYGEKPPAGQGRARSAPERIRLLLSRGSGSSGGSGTA